MTQIKATTSSASMRSFSAVLTNQPDHDFLAGPLSSLQPSSAFVYQAPTQILEIDVAVGHRGSEGSSIEPIDTLTIGPLKAPELFAGARTGGVDLAWADSNHLAVGAAAGNAPEVKVYDTSTGKVVADFFAFQPLSTQGVEVAWIDPSHLAVALGKGGAPEVKVYDLTGGSLHGLSGDYFAFDPSFKGGLHLAGNGHGMLAAAESSGGDIVSIRSLEGADLFDFHAFGGSKAGVDVAWIDQTHLFVTASGSSDVHVYDVGSGQPVLTSAYSTDHARPHGANAMSTHSEDAVHYDVQMALTSEPGWHFA